MTPPAMGAMGARHSAALYDTDSDLVNRTLPFLRDGLDRREDVVAVVSGRARGVLRDALGSDAAAVRWDVPGANPLHIGPAYEALRRFLGRLHAAGTPTRLVMEDDGGSGTGRGAARARSDAVTNDAWTDFGIPWLCLYDRTRHRPTTLEQVERVHPLLLDATGSPVANPHYLDPDVFVTHRPGPLSVVPGRPMLDLRPTGINDLPEVRRRVVALARRLGLSEQLCRDVELATGEVVTNALVHGAAPYRVRAWTRRGAVTVRVDDAGPGAGLATAGLRPPDGQLRGRGMWVVRQVTDVVHVGTGPDGTGVELQFPLPGRHGAGAPPGDPWPVISAYEHAAQSLGAFEGEELVVVALNEAARRMLGNADLMGRPLADLLAEADGHAVLDTFRETYTTGRSATAREWRMSLTGPDGGPREAYLHIECTPWRYPDGRMRGVLASATDVTERVLARRAAQVAPAEPPADRPRGLVGTVQQALLPPDLPVLPGVQIAARYLLAEADTAAGGDWFDAVVLPGGAVALLVGDVAGHGVAAAAVMGQLRAVLRERMRAGARLADAVAALDRFAAETPGAAATTACVAVLDLGGDRLRYCTAGHPPPLLVRPDGTARHLPPTGTGPLGTGSFVAVAEDRLGPDDLLLLYSDGLVERPGRVPAAGAVELALVAGDVRAGRVSAMDRSAPAERMCRLTLEMLTDATGHADDVTVLAAHRVPFPAELRVRIPAQPLAVRRARAELRAWLAALHAGPDDLLALEHAVGEVVTNGVQHSGAGPTDLITVDGMLCDDGSAIVTVTDPGRWRDADRASSGRGLALAAHLVDGLHVARDEAGTAVTLRRRLRRPALPLDRARTRTAPVSDRPFTVTRCDDMLVLTGTLDSVATPALERELLAATRGGTHALTVDLTGVDHLCSETVRVLHEVARRGAALDRPLRLVAPPGGAAYEILALVDLLDLVVPAAGE